MVEQFWCKRANIKVKNRSEHHQIIYTPKHTNVTYSITIQTNRKGRRRTSTHDNCTTNKPDWLLRKQKRKTNA